MYKVNLGRWRMAYTPHGCAQQAGMGALSETALAGHVRPCALQATYVYS